MYKPAISFHNPANFSRTDLVGNEH